MNIDVAKAIKELLFERESVVLPGLGAFVGKPAAAEVDYVKGAVQPPSKKIEFNTNIVINDGVLVNHIQKTALVTGQEAKTAIENYVAGIKKSLEQKEIVDIPGIGRLYKDYEQQVRFMPEGTNFEADSFGLPSVKFHPVVRRRTNPKAATASTAGAAAAATTVPPQVPPSPSIPDVTKGNEKSWAERSLPLLIALAAVVLAIALFVGLRGCSGEEPQANVPPERINVKPKEDVASLDDPAEEELTTDDTQPTEDDSDDAAEAPTYNYDNNENSSDDSGEPEPAADATSEEEVVPVPQGKPLFVVIHSFGSKANARKFSRQLERAGYTATTKMHNGLRRVGVEVPASRQNEVDDLINELGRKFKAKPVLVDY